MTYRSFEHQNHNWAQLYSSSVSTRIAFPSFANDLIHAQQRVIWGFQDEIYLYNIE